MSIIKDARAHLLPGLACLDIGPGIRPQQLHHYPVHRCIEPHWEYAVWLRLHGYEVAEGKARDLLPDTKPADVVFMLDVLDRMDDEDAQIVLLLAMDKALQQLVVFSPLGMHPQKQRLDGHDQWGLNGAQWQRQRSSWSPERIGHEQGWLHMVDTSYHGTYGAFFSVWTRP